MNKFSYHDWYSLTTGRDINMSEMLQAYKNITQGTVGGDGFFEKYGPGNALAFTHKPFERLKCYETLLLAIKNHDPEQFNKIHKGTPYYFMGWLAFQIEDYEKGIFYMDSGVSEDIRAKGPTFDVRSDNATPGIDFLLLQNPTIQVAATAAAELRAKVDNEIREFSNNLGIGIIPTAELVRKFIKKTGFFSQSGFRTIISSLYGYILEYYPLLNQIRLRSSETGTIEPFLLHPFKGSLILESILKLSPEGQKAKTLYKTIEYNSRLGVDVKDLIHDLEFEEIIEKMYSLIRKDESDSNICFILAFALRNTTAHKLSWPDILGNEAKAFTDLHNYVSGAIFWSIYKLWVE